MKQCEAAAVAFLVVAAIAGSAEARTQTYRIAGTLEYASDDAGLLGVLFTAGDPFSGSFSYDAADLTDGSPRSDYFTASSSTIVSSMVIGGYEFAGNLSGSIDLQGSTNTFYMTNGWASTPFVDLGSNPGRLLSIVLGGRSTSFEDTFPSGIDLADFSTARVSVFGDTGPGGPTFTLAGRIESLSEVPVPESTSLIIWSLFGVGCAAAWRRMTRAGR